MTENLRVPPPEKIHITNYEQQTLTTAMMRLLSFSWMLQIQTQQKTQAELFEVWSQVQRSRNRDKEQDKDRELQNMARGEPEILRTKLKDKNPLIQLAAIQVIHNRRIHLEKELIGRLSDPQAMIREAARHALVRLSRGVDFGPKATSGAAERRQAIRRWETWLARQQGPDSTAESTPLDPVDADAARWATELVQVGGAKESDILQRMREAPEPQGTVTLLLAIQDLKGPRQAKARQTLADRLADLEVELIAKRFGDEDAEVRRAALAAAAKKRAKPLIPDALLLLEDPDAGVAQAARATLKALSNQDFGPAPNAAAPDRAIAIGRWYQWWVKQKAK